MLVFLFTDIEGSTRLWEEHTGVMTAVIARHDQILRELVAGHGGRITKHTGDGITAVFETGQPLACALQAQVRFTAEPWGEIGALPIRAGLHAGEAEFYPSAGTPEGDYFGPPVNCTARVMSAAWGGQILLTQEVTQVSALPEQAMLLDLGQHLLKDVRAPQQLYQLDHPHLPRHQFPPPRTLSGRSIRQAVDQQGTQLAQQAPPEMAVSLVSATLLPAVLGDVSPGSPALTGNVGVLENLGAAALAKFLGWFAAHRRAGEPEEIQSQLQRHLQQRWAVDAALRSDASVLLRAVQGVDATLAAATGEVREALARGLAGLASELEEFGWVLGDMQDTLAEVRGLQRAQLDLQQLQLARTEELLALHKAQARVSLPATAEAAEVEPPRPAFLEEGAPDLAQRPVFVARERELAWLEDRLDAALAGQGGVVFVTGGPGRGKTALLDAFARQAMEAHANLLVTSGTCNAYSGVGDPYLPFREVLGMLSGEVEAHWAAGTISRDHARRLWAALPLAVQALLDHGPHVVPALLAGPALLSRARAAAPSGALWLQRLMERVERQPALSNDLEQSHLFQQVTNLLRALAEAHPLLLILDDLQWVDTASASLFFHLGRRLRGSRVLIAGTYRPEEVALGRAGERHPLETVLAEFKRAFGDVRLDLAEVKEPEGRDFVDALLDTEPNRLEDDFRQALFEHTGGHPLFTVELLRAMQDRGDLLLDSGGWWVEGSALDWDTLPARVEGVIEARIGRLDDELREILSVASVEGEEFTAQVVARVQDIPDRRLHRILSRDLQNRHRLVREQKGLSAGTRRLSRYRFAHALYQQYLYATLGEGERELVHHEVGAALAELYESSPEEVAVQLVHHFRSAGDRDQEAQYARLAGERAAARYANAEALRHLERALELIPESRVADRYALLLTRERVYDLLGERESQARDLAVLQKLSSALNDAQKRVEISLRQSDYARMTSDYGAAIKAARQGVALAQEAADIEGEARSHLAWAQALMRQGNYDAAIEHLSCGLDLARALGLARLITATVRLQGVVAFYRGDQLEARRCFEEALSAARQSGSRQSEANLLNNLGAVAGDQGDLQSALGFFKEALSIRAETGDRIGEGLALNNLGVVARDLGDYPAARTHLEQAWAIYREIAYRQGEVYTLNDLAGVLRNQGDIAGAYVSSDRALEIARDIGDDRGEGYALTGLGNCLASLGRWSEACAAFQRAISLREELLQLHLAMESRAGLAQLALAQGDLAQAQEHVATILAYLDGNNSLDGTDEPLRIYLVCYEVLHANQDKRADELLATAHRILQERAANIANEAVRRSFLERVPWHREILDEWAKQRQQS